jgi:DNA-binding LytR/AlgR family response regulator
MNVVIVEDEEYAVKRLVAFIHQLEPEWEIIHVFDEVEETVEWLKHHKHPSLIFMDIQLADGFSFEIFTQVEIKSQVIFTTAFDNYAVKAFRHNGLDYLLKPVQLELLSESITRFKKINSPQTIDIETFKSMIRAKYSTYKKRFLVKSGDQSNYIEVDDIAYFVSESSYSFAFLKSGNQYILDDTLEQIEQQLNPEKFFRINRKQLVTVKSIDGIKNHFNNRLSLILTLTLKDESIVSRV